MLDRLTLRLQHVLTDPICQLALFPFCRACTRTGSASAIQAIRVSSDFMACPRSLA